MTVGEVKNEHINLWHFWVCMCFVLARVRNELPAELTFGALFSCSLPTFLDISADTLTLTRLTFFHHRCRLIHFIHCLSARRPKATHLYTDLFSVLLSNPLLFYMISTLATFEILSPDFAAASDVMRGLMLTPP